MSSEQCPYTQAFGHAHHTNKQEGIVLTTRITVKRKNMFATL